MIKNNLKNKPYTYFFLKLLLLLGIVFVLDFSAGNILRYYYFKQKSGLQYRSNYAFEKTTEDILILGSSRANHHYIPSIFEKNIRQSCYNAGKDGEMIFYHYAVLKSVLKRYTPKIIIIDFHNSDLQNDERGYNRLSTLLPYYKTHKEVRPIAELKGPLEKWKLCSSIYPFNSSLFTIALNNARLNKREDQQGYLPVYGSWNMPMMPDMDTDDKGIDTIKRNIYESLIKDCLEKKIQLFIVKSPTYVKNPPADTYVLEIKKIASHFNVPFFDYSNDPRFIIDNGKLFHDRSHLNDSGAHLFSEIIVKVISSKISEDGKEKNK
jgi:hypothetical protein